jgi:hypothetical protein
MPQADRAKTETGLSMHSNRREADATPHFLAGTVMGVQVPKWLWYAPPESSPR